VRSALEAVHGTLLGIKVSNDVGYIVEECPKEEQPPGPPDKMRVSPLANALVMDGNCER